MDEHSQSVLMDVRRPGRRAEGGVRTFGRTQLLRARKIGDGFPARDPVARFITGLAMISKDMLRALEDMPRLERDTPEEIGRRVSMFRRQAAAVQQAVTFINDARRMCCLEVTCRQAKSDKELVGLPADDIGPPKGAVVASA
jgi:hypothetical protein